MLATHTDLVVPEDILTLHDTFKLFQLILLSLALFFFFFEQQNEHIEAQGSTKQLTLRDFYLA